MPVPADEQPTSWGAEQRADEIRSLEEVSTWFDEESGFYRRIVEFTWLAIEPFVVGGTCLELGPAGGAMTRRLAERFDTLTVVDASAAYVRAATRVPGVEGHVALFEEFESPIRFDTVVMAHVLEHVFDPVAILARSRSWLAPGGRVIVVVPNADSLHRRLGVKLGLLSRVDELNDQDRSVGHRRVYRRELLDAHTAAAGFETAAKGGVFLKLLSNQQMEGFGDEALVDAMFALGADLPQLCSEIYAVLRVPTERAGNP